MKKILLILLLSMCVFLAYSQNEVSVVDEIDKQQDVLFDEREGFSYKSSKTDRFVEIGTSIDFSFSNNYFHLDDLLTETIVLDLERISNDLSNGLQFNAVENTYFFVGFNTKSFFVSVDGGLSGNAYINLSQDVFKVLGQGIQQEDKLNLALSGGASFYFDVNVNAGLAFKTPFGPIKVEVSPSYFVPLMYMENTTCSLNAVFNDDGTMKFTSEDSIYLYSALESTDLSTISSVFSKGGFDVGLTFGYQLFSFLDLGLSFKNIPILGSTIDPLCAYKISMDKDIPSLIDIAQGAEIGDWGLVTEEIVSTDTIIVNRPFKLVLDANWRVFNSKFFQIIPLVSLKFSDETSMTSFDIDYQASALIDIGFLEAAYTTARYSDVFYQQLSAALKFRILEVNLAVSMNSANFLRSFAGAGLGAKFGIVVGF